MDRRSFMKRPAAIAAARLAAATTIGRRPSVALAGVVTMASLGASLAQAHHSYSMFDSSRTATIEGVFAEFEWKNPHAHLWVYVESASEPGGQGQDLVVETTGLSTSATVAPGVMLRTNARVLERFSLVEPNVLEVIAEVTAPAIFKEPVSATTRYWRDPAHIFTEFEACVSDDRAFDHATGLERFEATPPADLPPPPTSSR